MPLHETEKIPLAKMPAHSPRSILSDRSESNPGTIPLSLTIRPACGLPGDYDYQTDGKALLRLLRLQTDLPAYTLERFEEGLRNRLGARLMGVDLSDSVLTDMGYFID